MLINPADKNDVTMRFRRTPQGVLAKVCDWIGVLSLAVSVSAILIFAVTNSIETEGIALRMCLSCLNIAIVAFVVARLIELVDRALRTSGRDRQ